MTRVLDILEVYIQLQEFKYLRLDGSTKTEEKRHYAKEFNAPVSPNFVFLSSTHIGGLGLKLHTTDLKKGEKCLKRSCIKKMDDERRQKERYRSRLMEEHEVPDWAYTKPDNPKDMRGKGFDYETANLLGKRRRKEVKYAGTLGEMQFFKAVERWRSRLFKGTNIMLSVDASESTLEVKLERVV
ncbi:probable ATP-dependent DNA helicase CHR12 [Tanacetum coccineum]